MKYTKELLEPIVLSSMTWAEVCRKLKVKSATGAQTHIKKRAIDFQIDFSHFIGRSWNKGKPSVNKRPIQHYLVSHGPFIKSDGLKKRLIKEGLKKHQCEDCSRVQWEFFPIPIELHHINGDHEDNRLENLRILCPNCHALT